MALKITPPARSANSVETATSEIAPDANEGDERRIPVRVLSLPVEAREVASLRRV
jgi:hypothetical protein